MSVVNEAKRRAGCQRTAMLYRAFAAKPNRWMNVHRLAVALSAAVIAWPAMAADIKGQVTHIVDGDTFDMRAGGDTIRIRLCGIDAPERGADSSKESTKALAALISDRTLRCVRIGEGTPCDGFSRATSRNRTVAQCFLGNRDIATEMIRSGHACDYRKHSGGYYHRVGGSSACVSPRK